MRTKVAWTVVALSMISALWGQDLTPRAYTITPLHANAVTLTYSYSTGSLDFNGSIPVTGATGEFSVPSVAYYHSFNFFGRSANFVAALPYGIGNFEGEFQDQVHQRYKSGLFDSVFRFSVNLKGGPAMQGREFARWKQKTILGASVKVIPPTGQYDDTRIINWSTNRWSLKPELGYSRRIRDKWLLDGYGGVWFFTANSQFFTGAALATQKQAPIGALEGHISRDFRPFLWFSFDGNFWFGGTTTTGGVTNSATRQTSSRLGCTGSFPIDKGKHNTIKASVSRGAYVRFGGNYTNFSIAWQYSWLGRPK